MECHLEDSAVAAPVWCAPGDGGEVFVVISRNRGEVKRIRNNLHLGHGSSS
jgi:hypothetical protein